MATGPKLNATGAQATGRRPSKAAARKQEVPKYGAYPTVRHLAGSRVPFSTAYVESLVTCPEHPQGGGIAIDTAFCPSYRGGSCPSEADVAQTVRDAFEWGWINQTGDVGTDGEYLWIGRL